MKTKDFSLRVKNLSEDGTFEGYGSVSGNVDSYGDRVMPGAFAASLAKHRQDGTKVLMLWQHSTHEPIGVWDELAEDGKGLWGKGRLILEVQKAREVYALMKNGAIGGLSIGYREVKTTQDGNVLNLDELDLREISPVSFPANTQARIEAVKSERMAEFSRRLRDGDPMPAKEFESILREVGISKSMATQIASVGYVKAALGEPEGEKNDEKIKLLLAILND